MTQTDVNLRELQQEIAHLVDVSEKGWILQWGNSEAEAAQPVFELVCRGANAVQVKNISDRISAAYKKALVELV